MPIYDYVCRTCEHRFEALVRGGKEPSCPSCEGTDLERQFSLPTVRSEGTKDRAMRAANKRDASQARERMHEQLRYERSHDRHG
jgi:putative FmdB family regulatory protein